MYFALTSAALIFAGLCGAALSYDGSTYLYAILETQASYTPNERLINLLLHWPVLLVSHFTSNMGILRAVFGLVYAVIPAIALVLSWWVVRKRAHYLFIWPALSIGLGTLPGQFYMVSEGIYVVQLGWPIILSIILRIPRSHIALIAVLTVAIIFGHPFAVVLVAFMTVLAFLVGAFDKEARRRMWLSAAIFGGVLVIAVLKFAVSRSGYETEQMSLAIVRRDFDASVIGLPLVSLVCVGAAALMILVTPYVARFAHSALFHFVVLIEFTGVISAGVLLIAWASAADNWIWASGFRSFALLISVVFMALASAEGILSNLKTLKKVPINWLHRTRTIQLAATMFLLVLCTQSVIWLKVTDKLRDTMFQSSWGCVSMSSMSWLAMTPLSWTTPIYSILIQDKSPERLVLPDDGCAELDLTKRIHLTEFDERDWSGGWFDFASLKQHLEADHKTNRGCWFIFTSGWYGAQSYDADYWWRWSAGDASLRVYLDRDTNIVMQGDIESFQQPNTIDILVNGESRAMMNVTWSKMGAMQLPPLSLNAGENTIELVSGNPSTQLTADDRPLAIAVANLGLATTDNGVACELHP